MIIKQVETSRARMFTTPGNENIIDEFLNESRQNDNMNYRSIAMMDESYLFIGNHLDKGIVDKILNQEYVDFAELLPKVRGASVHEDDHRMELVRKGGSTFFVPVTDRESTQISDFGRWEQAFQIFSNVYTTKYPNKAPELIQYNHVIHTASLSYTWDNVYHYDKEFRLHFVAIWTKVTLSAK